MKELILSKSLKEAVAPEIVKEIYRIICELPSPGIEHHFCISTDKVGTNLIHSIPTTNFCYTLSFSKSLGAITDTHVTAVDIGDKIMMALSSEIK